MNNNIVGFGSPGRYIQAKGLIDNIDSYIAKLGNNALAVIDVFFYEEFTKKFSTRISKNCKIQTVKFNGECSGGEIDRISTLAKQEEIDVIVGIGGGKTLDTAKAVAKNNYLPLICLPTTASNDSPCSALSVIYKDNGEFSHSIWHNKNPDIVLVDVDIIAKAPVRFLIAGMGDALSTFFEARANAQSNTNNYIDMNDGGYIRSKSAMALSKLCYDILMEDGIKAKIAVENGAVTPSLENIIEANILLSGLGFENTGCAGAHCIADALTIIQTKEKTLHGEKVTFGILCQLVAENSPGHELDEVISFCIKIGLPITLEELHIEPTKENIRKIANASMKSGWDSEPFYVDSDMVYDYIITANALGHYYKNMFNRTGT